MDKFLPLLIANWAVLGNKVHSFHTNAKGAEFLYLHPFFGDIYGFFGEDNLDKLRERARQLNIEIPNTLSEYVASAKIKEATVVPSISGCVPIVLRDLSFMCDMLQVGVDESGKENDIVTQNILSDLQDTCGVFKWKLSMMSA